jgi:sugar lactone lactonase YvrE
MKSIGNSHGDVAISSKGEVYVSVGGQKGGIQVFASTGEYLRNLPKAPNFHGFVIHKEEGGEFIYGAAYSEVVKLGLYGKRILTIKGDAVPDEFKRKRKEKSFVRFTAADVTPNGDIYITDGYSSDYIHRFDSKGKYIQSFGGKKDPYKIRTLHKMAIDTRFDPPRIIGCDREGRRLLHFSLDGKEFNVIASNMRRPAAVAIFGEWAAVGEIAGRVSFVNKEGKTVLELGTNDTKGETATNNVAPEKWRPGIFTAPHGVAFDASGNLYVCEYNKWGRVMRFNLKK